MLTLFISFLSISLRTSSSSAMHPNTVFKYLLLFSLLSAAICKNRRVDLTCSHIKAFVDGHNLRRFMAAQGLLPNQPAASNMRYMVWDDELAEKAASWAEHGEFEHNPDRTVASNRWPVVGENLYLTKLYNSEYYDYSININAALESWFGEYKDFEFKPFENESAAPIGHYTQMVWADTTRVGCGISQVNRNWTETLYVCQYGPAGNYLGKLPYKKRRLPGYLRCTDSCSLPYGARCSYT